MSKPAIWCVIAAAALPACCTFNTIRDSAPFRGLSMAEHLERQTVAIVSWVDGENISQQELPLAEVDAKLAAYCTGVWLTGNAFVTAEHCVNQLGMSAERTMLEELGFADDLPHWDATGQRLMYSAFGDVADEKGRRLRSSHPAVVLAIDPDNDLALVVAMPDKGDAGTEIPNHEVATIATNVRVGEDIEIVGQTGGLWWTYMKGNVAQLRPFINAGIRKSSKPMNVIQVSAPVWGGNSGGGAFNSEGQLIGIASFIRQHVPNVGFFISYESVRYFAQTHGIR